MMEETDLIAALKKNDESAFKTLVLHFQDRVYSTSLSILQNEGDAEDLSQEVWLKAYQALGSFRFDSSFYTWLRRITINAFLNHRRSSFFRRNGQTTAVQLVQIDSETSFEAQSSSPENIYNKLLFENVVSALAELTPSQRLSFLLRHYEGMSYDEIANAMNCSSGTVKKGVARAIGKLRARLSPEAKEPETLTSLANEY